MMTSRFFRSRLAASTWKMPWWILGLVGLACSWSGQEPAPAPEPDVERSIEDLLSLCSYEGRREPDRQACFEAGQKLVAAGRQPEAIQPLFYACNGQLYDACIELGLLHLRGDGVPRDEKEAFLAFATASLEDGNAGGWSVLGTLRLEELTLKQRDGVARRSHGTCSRSTTGWPCHNYGVLLACGYFGDVDLPHALSAFHRGCFLSDPRACDLAGKLQSGATSLPCSLVGPDPDNPVDLTLNLDPPDPSETWPEGEERFERTPFKVER